MTEACQPEATKVCADCLLDLPLSAYTPAKRCVAGVLPHCRACRRVRSAAYRRAKPEVHRTASAKWRRANPERQRAACRQHYQNNVGYYREKNELWRLANPEKTREYLQRYSTSNPDRRRATYLAFYCRHKTDPLYRIRRRVTSRTHAYLGGRRNGAMREVGCTPEALRAHLESLFCPGMGWHNAGEWEIDHFYPLAAIGRSPDWLDVAAVCNYRNLRPLWRSANRCKRATVLPEAKALFDAIRDMLLEGKA